MLFAGMTFMNHDCESAQLQRLTPVESLDLLALIQRSPKCVQWTTFLLTNYDGRQWQVFRLGGKIHHAVAFDPSGQAAAWLA